MSAGDHSPATLAFDAVADSFDARFGAWRSVAAQRRTVREALAHAFPVGSRLIEIGGGTGEDALWLIDHGRDVLMTDPSPAMVSAAAAKFAFRAGGSARVAGAEDLGRLAEERELAGEPQLDGAYSNFAALNCLPDITPLAQHLSRLLRTGAPVMLVLFGTCCPGEMLVEALRGRPRNMFRRLKRGKVAARLGGLEFGVWYHRASTVRRAMAPWFRFEGRQAIGLFVPPSAAEPWISTHPRLLDALDALDDQLGRPLAMFGDHVLYRFARTPAEARRD